MTEINKECSICGCDLFKENISYFRTSRCKPCHYAHGKAILEEKEEQRIKNDCYLCDGCGQYHENYFKEQGWDESFQHKKLVKRIAKAKITREFINMQKLKKLIK